MNSIQEAYNEAIQNRKDKTVWGFGAGAILGALFGTDLLLAIIAGIIGGVVVWCLYSTEVEKLEKIHKPKG
jgi:hypothetical protein